MRQIRKSEDPLQNKFYSQKNKRELIVGPLKLSKNLFNPISKSEKNSPSSKSSRVTDFSPKTKGIPFAFQSPKLNTEPRSRSKQSPRTKNFFGEKPQVSELIIKKLPSKLMSLKTVSLKSNYSEKSLKLNSSRKGSLKKFSKEKDELILIIKNSFKTTLNPPPTCDRFYIIDKLIGQGAFGKVLLGRQVLTNKKVAIKAIDRLHLSNEYSRQKILREVYILKKVKSKYVVKILEVFETNEYFLIVMEYLPGGDLLSYLKRTDRIPEDQCKKFFYQIVLGLSAIHKCEILHRDIKLDNILIDKSLRFVKICDFGVSKLVQKGEIITDHCGTPAYLAPEIVLNQGYEGYWSDIWSLGVLLYCMSCGTVPFKASTISDLHKFILQGKFELPEYLSTNLKHLIKNMLVIIPNKRIPIEKILRHRWFDRCNDLFIDSTEDDIQPSHEIIQMMETFGYPKQHIINSLELKTLNHTYAVYKALDLKD